MSDPGTFDDDFIAATTRAAAHASIAANERFLRDHRFAPGLHRLLVFERPKARGVAVHRVLALAPEPQSMKSGDPTLEVARACLPHRTILVRVLELGGTS